MQTCLAYEPSELLVAGIRRRQFEQVARLKPAVGRVEHHDVKRAVCRRVDGVEDVAEPALKPVGDPVATGVVLGRPQGLGVDVERKQVGSGARPECR